MTGTAQADVTRRPLGAPSAPVPNTVSCKDRLFYGPIPPTLLRGPASLRSTRLMARRPILALTVLSLLAATAPQAAAQNSMGGMDHSMHKMGPEIVIPKGAIYTKADVEFMQGMIAHHAQAIVMAKLAETNSTNQSLLKLSRKIDQSQIPEILIMQDWLRRNNQFAPDTSSWHDMHMDGMLTADEIKALGAAKGTEFDRLFLDGMIKHHAGAIKMVEDLFKSPGAGQEVDANVFANDVVTAQTAEIGIMRRLLTQLPPK